MEVQVRELICFVLGRNVDAAGNGDLDESAQSVAVRDCHAGRGRYHRVFGHGVETFELPFKKDSSEGARDRDLALRSLGLELAGL